MRAHAAADTDYALVSPTDGPTSPRSSFSLAAKTENICYTMHTEHTLTLQSALLQKLATINVNTKPKVTQLFKNERLYCHCSLSFGAMLISLIVRD